MIRASAATFCLITCAAFALADDPTSMPEATTNPAAATQPLPTPQQVIDRYIAVTGGAEAYAQITSRHAAGVFTLPDLGIEGTIETSVRADGNALVVITIPRIGTIRQGVTGDVVWVSHPIDGPRILTGPEAAATRRSLSLAPEITLAGYRDSRVVGVVSLNGRDAYRLDLVSTDADVIEQRFYDTQSGLLVKTVGTTGSDLGKLAVATFFGDYSDVPPIRMPLRVRQAMSGMSPESIMKTVEHNVDLPDTLFALPSEVAALQHPATTQATRTPATQP